MLSMFKGLRPDVTPVQAIATVVAGIPILAALLRAFGVYDTSPRQEEALSDALASSGVLAGLLIGGDAVIRAARNGAAARTELAALTAGGEPPLEAEEIVGDDPEASAVTDDELPSDDEELAGLP